MNRAHPGLKFEIEKPVTTPTGKSLSLLDFTVTISDDGKIQFIFYKKKGEKLLFVHYKSAIPRNTKTSIIRNERKRTDQCCSLPTLKTKHNNVFDDILRFNEYPEHLIKETHPKKFRDNHNSQNHENIDWHYLRIPCISDGLDNKLRNMFQKPGFPVRLIWHPVVNQNAPPKNEISATQKMSYIRLPAADAPTFTLVAPYADYMTE